MADVRKYEAFYRSQGSLVPAIILSSLFTFLWVPLFSIFATNRQRQNETIYFITTAVLALITIMVWISVALRFLQSKNIGSPALFSLFQDFTLVAITLFCGGRLFTRVYYGQCDDPTNFGQTYTCNPHADSFGLPLDSVATLMSLPLIYCIALRDTRYETIWFVWTLTVIIITISIWWSKAYVAVTGALMYLVVAAFLVYENQRLNLKMYNKTVEAEQLLEDNQRMQADNTALEMRHMIANVAHDLKTPLASFLSGVETIGHVIEEFQGRVETKRRLPDIRYVNEALDSMQASVKNIRNTNSFMTMTINRCIDFTKASQGLKLIPKPETVDLRETLDLPLHVMKDMQSRVAITLTPFPPRVCSHIITDKQWLQENILCLLSNAVKYSNRGCVTVSMSFARRRKRTEPSLAQESPDSTFKKKPSSSASSPASAKRSYRVKVISDVNQELLSCSSRTPTRNNFNTALSGEGAGAGRGAGLSDLAGEGELQQVEEEEMLRFEVEDSGIGLTNEVMLDLFNPFKQAQRLAGGTGLGLYSLAKRVEALHGLYGVQRRRDGAEGSLFWFAIPYRPDSTAAEEAANMTTLFEASQQQVQHVSDGRPMNYSVSERSSNNLPSFCSTITANTQYSMATTTDGSRVIGGGSGKAMHILLVDDSVPILKMTSMMLMRQGHILVQAENGAEALERLAEASENNQQFDVVLMDLQMPVMDGLEAVRRLRKQEQENTHVHQLVLGVSANSDAETMNGAYLAGVDGFMGKPFSINTFYENYKQLKDKIVAANKQ